MKRGTRDDDDRSQYRRLPWRRRVLLLLLAVSTAGVIVYLLFERPGGVQAPSRSGAGEPRLCPPGRTADCVGGTARVIVPAAAAASAR